jgi:hypothetical protein
MPSAADCRNIVVGGRRSLGFGGEHDRRSCSAWSRSGQSCSFDRCYRTAS